MVNENINKFIQWYFNEKQTKKSNYFNNDKEIFYNKLDEIGLKFNKNYDFNPFNLDLNLLSESDILNIKSKLELKGGDFNDYNKKLGNGIPKALLGKKNYIAFLNEKLFENQHKSLEYPTFFLRKQFILFLINEGNYTSGSANSYASYVSSAYNKLLKKHFNINFFGLIEYCCKENISDEFEDLLDSSISFVLKNADEANKKKYSYGLTEYKYFLKEIFDFPYDNEQYIPQYLSDEIKIEDELAAKEKEDIIKFREEIKKEYETIFEIDRDSLIANFRFRMITQDRLYGDVYFPIRLLKKIFYQNKKDKEFFDKFILDQIENIRIYNSSNKSFILLKNIETLSIDENNQVQCSASADWEDFSLLGNVFTELGEEGKYDLFKANNLREIAIDHIYTMKDVLLLHKSSLNGLVNLTNILKERGLVKSGKEAVKQLALIGNQIIDEEVLDDNDIQLLTNDLIFLGNKLHLQLMSSKENLKKKNR